MRVRILTLQGFRSQAAASVRLAASAIRHGAGISLEGDGQRALTSSQKDTAVKISNATVLVTGANRGLGKALVDEALRRGAKRIYAGARQPFFHPDSRVVPLVLDITDADKIRAAVSLNGKDMTNQILQRPSRCGAFRENGKTKLRLAKVTLFHTLSSR